MKYFTNLKIAQAIAFLTIPIVLVLVNGGLLESISAYAYTIPLTFSMLLTLSGALFMYDGFVERKRWYNVFMAASLFGVILFPYLDFMVVHYVCASIFFIGSLFNMVYFSSGKERFPKIMTAALVLFGISGSLCFEWYSLFFAEWIGMVPISVHFVLESLGKID